MKTQTQVNAAPGLEEEGLMVFLQGYEDRGPNK
jgi:hypothetical protein